MASVLIEIQISTGRTCMSLHIINYQDTRGGKDAVKKREKKEQDKGLNRMGEGEKEKDFFSYATRGKLGTEKSFFLLLLLSLCHFSSLEKEKIAIFRPWLLPCSIHSMSSVCKSV